MWNLIENLYDRLIRDREAKLTVEPLQKLRPTDLRDTTNHWGSFAYHVELQPVIINGSTGQGADAGGFSLADDGTHPYVEALLRARCSADPEAAIVRTLQLYHRRLTQSSGGLPPVLLTRPSTALDRRRRERYRYPWSPPADTAPDNERSWQPVSDAEIRHRGDALYRLWNRWCSDTTRQQRHQMDQPISATALIDADNRWRWLPRGEQARRLAAIAGATGCDPVALKIHQVVYRQQAPMWPQVVAGHITPSAAQQQFDQLFDRCPPPQLQPWLQQLDNRRRTG